jgi:hypothetical protein
MHAIPLPKLPVARRRNTFDAKHAPASNLYNPFTCETVTAVDAQIKAARINPTSVLRKFTTTFPSLYWRNPSGRLPTCIEASHAFDTVPNNFAEISITVEGTIRQNNRPWRFAA